MFRHLVLCRHLNLDELNSYPISPHKHFPEVIGILGSSTTVAGTGTIVWTRERPRFSSLKSYVADKGAQVRNIVGLLVLWVNTDNCGTLKD